MSQLARYSLVELIESVSYGARPPLVCLLLTLPAPRCASLAHDQPDEP